MIVPRRQVLKSQLILCHISLHIQLEEDEQKSRLPGYSLDDQVVIEAKEKGRELFAHLSLSERKQTLDDKVYIYLA